MRCVRCLRWLVGVLCLGWAGAVCAAPDDAPAARREAPPVGRKSPATLKEGVPASFRNRTLVIATKIVPPFAMKDDMGRWRGISIELWKDIAETLQLRYTFKEYTLAGMLKAVREKKVDAAVAALTISMSREKNFDFSHPFFNTGLGIAIPMRNQRSGVWVAMGRLFSWHYFSIFFLAFLGLCAIGVMIWFLEHRRNREHFGEGSMLQGIGSGLWWAIVTMTTVGYGDKAPKTLPGRILASVWIFASLVLVSYFTASLTMILTVTQLETTIKGPQDLYRMRIATVVKSTSARYLASRKIPMRTYGTVREGLQSILRGETDAMVYDAPLLRYLINDRFRGSLRVLQAVFRRQDYGIALPEGSPLRESVNRALLQVIYSERWRQLQTQLLGSGP